MQSPDSDVNRVQPQDVMWQRRLALESQLGAHDSRHDKHQRSFLTQPYACGAPGKLRQFPVFALAKVGGQIPRVLAGDEQMLDVSVAPGELVVWSDVICQRMRVTQTTDLIPRSTGVPPQSLAGCPHRPV